MRRERMEMWDEWLATRLWVLRVALVWGLNWIKSHFVAVGQALVVELNDSLTANADSGGYLLDWKRYLTTAGQVCQTLSK